MKFHVHNGRAYWFCPGCQVAHSVPIDGSGGQGRNWAWNGSTASPTLQPSVRHFTPPHAYSAPDGTLIERAEKTLCHYWLRDGCIELLDDSSAHSVRGVHALPDFPENYGLPGLIPV